jgi:hypothetical protein
MALVTCIARTSYPMDFTQDDLVDGVLTIPHGLRQKAVLVVIYNDSWEQVGVMPKPVDEDNCGVDLTNAEPISNTWHSLTKR